MIVLINLLLEAEITETELEVVGKLLPQHLGRLGNNLVRNSWRCNQGKQGLGKEEDKGGCPEYYTRNRRFHEEYAPLVVERLAEKLIKSQRSFSQPVSVHVIQLRSRKRERGEYVCRYCVRAILDVRCVSKVSTSGKVKHYHVRCAKSVGLITTKMVSIENYR
jgi:hypothetical protein